MPLSKYFSGHGEQVMREMVKKYGPEKGKQVFYATVNAQKKKHVVKSAASVARKGKK